MNFFFFLRLGGSVGCALSTRSFSRPPFREGGGTMMNSFFFRVCACSFFKLLRFLLRCSVLFHFLSRLLPHLLPFLFLFWCQYGVDLLLVRSSNFFCFLQLIL